MCAGRLLGRSKSFVPEGTPLAFEKFEIGREFQRSCKKRNEPVIWPRGQFSCRRPAGSALRIKEGFMWMHSSSQINKSWKLRYIVLLEEKLCYLKEQTGTLSFQTCYESDFKVIEISEIISLKVNSDGVTQSTDSESEVFYVKTSNSKYSFKCRNQDERNSWVTAILAAKSSTMMKER